MPQLDEKSIKYRELFAVVRHPAPTTEPEISVGITDNGELIRIYEFFFVYLLRGVPKGRFILLVNRNIVNCSKVQWMRVTCRKLLIAVTLHLKKQNGSAENNTHKL